jgi:hypothetical protein
MPSHRSKRNHFSSRKKKQSGWVNFLAFVGGITASLCLFALLLSYFWKKQEGEGVVNETREGEPGEVVNFSSFEHKLAVSHPDELKQMLLDLDFDDSGLNLPAFVEHHRKRIRLAEQILLFKTDEPSRVVAVEAKLKSYSRLYNSTLTRSNSPEEYTDEISKMLDRYRLDSNLVIRRIARTGLVSYDMITTARELNKDGASKPDEDGRVNPENLARLEAEVTRLLDKIIALNNEFPDEETLATNLKSSLDSVDFFNQELGIRLKDGLIARVSELQGGQAEILVMRISDEIKLKNTGFQELAAKAPTSPRVAVAELLAVAKELAADSSTGPAVLNELNVLGNWLEQQNEIEQATGLYQQILDSVEDRRNSQVRTLARELAEAGLRRTEAIGQIIRIHGSSVNEKILTAQDLESAIVVILFWKSDRGLESPRLIETLREISVLPLEFSRIKVVVADIYPAETTEKSRLSRLFPDFYFINCDRGDETLPSLTEQFPISIVPRAIIVDDRGIVRRTNVSLSNLSFVLDAIIRMPEKLQPNND